MSHKLHRPWFVELAAALRALPREWDDRRGEEFDCLPSDCRLEIARRRVNCVSRAGRLIMCALLDHRWLPGYRFQEMQDKAHWARNSERTKFYEQGAIKFLGMFLEFCDEHADHLPPGMPPFVPLRVQVSNVRPEDVSGDDFARACEAIAWLLEMTGHHSPQAAEQSDVEGIPVPTDGESSAAAADDAWLGYSEIARRYDLDPEKLRKRLERYRRNHHDCYREVAEGERRPNEPKYLYRLSSINPVITAYP